MTWLPGLQPVFEPAWTKERKTGVFLCTILRVLQSRPRLVSAIGRVVAY